MGSYEYLSHRFGFVGVEQALRQRLRSYAYLSHQFGVAPVGDVILTDVTVQPVAEVQVAVVKGDEDERQQTWQQQQPQQPRGNGKFHFSIFLLLLLLLLLLNTFIPTVPYSGHITGFVSLF